MKIEEKIIKILQPILDKEDIKIVEVKYEKENKTNFLRVYLDTRDMDICIKATKIINPILDEHDLINEQYCLEVGTKGIEEE